MITVDKICPGEWGYVATANGRSAGGWVSGNKWDATKAARQAEAKLIVTKEDWGRSVEEEQIRREQIRERGN